MPEGNELTARVETVETKIDRLSRSVDERFNQVDERFNQVDAAIAEQRAYTEFVYERLDRRIAALEGGFARFERKLDHVIDRLDTR